MAVDYFLTIDGIPGESTDDRQQGSIDLESFSWGETNVSAPGRGGGAGAGAGKVAMQDFHFTARVSKASPALFLACASGKHAKQAVFTARKAGERPQEFLVMTFKDVQITSYQIGGAEAAGDTPIDQVSLAFGEIVYEYRPQRADGSLDTPVRAGWSATANKAI